MKRLLIIASLALITVSCKKNKIEIDSSSAQSFSETVDQISKSLPLLQQSKFKEALEIIFEYKTSHTVDNEARWSIVRTLLNGKSDDEIFDLAEQIALENQFIWNRNQVPLVNGIPKLETLSVTEEDNTNSNSVIQKFDFGINQDDKGITLIPFFYNEQGQEMQLDQSVVATIEVINSGNVVYNFRSSINPISKNNLYRNNGIEINYSSLDFSKVKNETLEISVRIPNNDVYLMNKKLVTIPSDLLKLNPEDFDSITIHNAAITNRIVSKDMEMIKSLSNRFISNLSKKNFSGAYALTRNNEWSTYQKFSSNSSLKELEQSIIKRTTVLDTDEKVSLVEVSVDLKDKTSVNYQLTLEHINNKWFIVDFK